MPEDCIRRRWPWSQRKDQEEDAFEKVLHTRKTCRRREELKEHRLWTYDDPEEDNGTQEKKNHIFSVGGSIQEEEVREVEVRCSRTRRPDQRTSS